MAAKRIYISGTYDDLKEYRNGARLTIEDFGHAPVDSYHAGPEPVVESCLSDVASCDALVGIVGWRYGWVPKDGDPRSITRREFDQAKGKTRLVFVRSEKEVDLAADIKAFRENLAKEVRPAIYSDPDNFVSELRKALKEKFGPKPEAANLHLLPFFCDRGAQYKRIDDVLWERSSSKSTRLVMLVVHGDQFQSGSAFIDVLECRLAEFPATKALGNAEVFRIEWPDSFTSANDFRKRLLQAVAGAVMRNRHASREEVERTIKAISAPIVMDAYLPTSEWNKTGARAALEFFGFWDEWAAVARSQPILVALRVEYEEIQRTMVNFLRRRSLERANNEIRQFLGRLPAPQQTIQEVLPELPRVARKDAVEWSQMPLIKKCVKGAILEPDINSLYSMKFAHEPRGEPRMEPLARELIQLLKERV